MPIVERVGVGRRRRRPQLCRGTIHVENGDWRRLPELHREGNILDLLAIDGNNMKGQQLVLQILFEVHAAEFPISQKYITAFCRDRAISYPTIILTQ